MRDNPVIFLFKKVWEYSRDNHNMLVLYVALFAIAGIIHLIEPIVIGQILNTIQERGITRERMAHRGGKRRCAPGACPA